MEATDVVDLGVLNQAPDLGLLQVVEVVVVGGTQVGAKGSVVAGDDGAAAASLLLGVDAILDSQASGLDGIVEDGGILVVTGTADVDDTVGGEDVLGTSGAVLGSTAGDELGIVVVEEVLVEGDVLILGEDSIVLLQVILVKEGLVTVRLDVCCRERGSSSSARNRRRGGSLQAWRYQALGETEGSKPWQNTYQAEGSPGRRGSIPWREP